MTTHNTIGKSLPRVDARGKVTGETPYSGDLSMPGMLYMKTLFAERPHARVKSIDTSKAEAAPGVKAVYTAKDVPVNEYGLQWQDQPVLCGPASPLTPYHPRRGLHRERRETRRGRGPICRGPGGSCRGGK
jgi:CO/xanthine dehydrogenase Mo-binding subunit